jgi:hypothetical protein
MGRIFRNAIRVLAWVDAFDKAERGMTLLTKLSRLSRPERQQIVETLPSTKDETFDWESWEHRTCITNFLRLPWFTRLWM